VEEVSCQRAVEEASFLPEEEEAMDGLVEAHSVLEAEKAGLALGDDWLVVGDVHRRVEEACHQLVVEACGL